MKKISKLSVVFLIVLLIFSCFSACGSPDSAETDQDLIPDEIQAVRDPLIQMAADYALTLDGEWGDQHAALMASGEEKDFAGFTAMKSTLDDIRIESGAYYVYALVPETAESPENFLITVDGSVEPDDWLAPYETEVQFNEAWAGTPAAARSAWGNGDDGADPVWSVFAPIHDSEGNVVAILGIDYPVPEIDNFPEWNRDKAEWNGMTE